MPRSEYAIYRGENLVVVGTAAECAEHQNIKKETVYFLASGVNRRRVESRSGIHGIGQSKGKVAFKLDNFEDNMEDEG